MILSNVFENISGELKDEFFQDLIRSQHFRLERIVSRGHRSPDGFWYDQEQDEWVMVLKGRAALSLEGIDEILILNPGDHVNIPAHRKHRVEWTEPKEDTIWLAIHYG